jgi:transposase
MLPQCYPNYKTVHRRFQQWFRDEVLRAVLTDLANTLRDDGEVVNPSVISASHVRESLKRAPAGASYVGMIRVQRDGQCETRQPPRSVRPRSSPVRPERVVVTPRQNWAVSWNTIAAVADITKATKKAITIARKCVRVVTKRAFRAPQSRSILRAGEAMKRFHVGS